MIVHLRYGKTGLVVDVPDRNFAGELRMRDVPPLPEPEAAVRHALRQPPAGPPLADLCRGRKSAVVVISDCSRPVPNTLLLPPILATLAEAGLPDSAVTLLIATGLHRPNEGAELDALIGHDVARRYRVINHAGRDRDSHVSLGDTARGTPVEIDRAYVEADLKIVTGLIEPHLMAGYSGGRKGVCPGLGSWRTIRDLHSPAFLEDPQCRAGVLNGNPLHAELLEIAALAGLDFLVNVTLDTRRRVTGVFAGEHQAALLAGVYMVDRAARVPVERPADVVLASSAGYPLDTTFYQAIKGAVGALPAVRPGGTLILATSLSEGLGGPEFTRLLSETPDLPAFMRQIQEPGVFTLDQWQLEELGIARRKVHVMVYSDGVAADTLRGCHVDPHPSVEVALSAAIARHGPDCRVLAIPDGPYVIPDAGTAADVHGDAAPAPDALP